jgi:hypothetical protein
MTYKVHVLKLFSEIANFVGCELGSRVQGSLVWLESQESLGALVLSNLAPFQVGSLIISMMRMEK